MTDEIQPPTDEELELLLGPHLSVKITIDEKVYGTTFQLPAGWPARAANEEAAVALFARQIGSAMAQTIYNHYLKDMA